MPSVSSKPPVSAPPPPKPVQYQSAQPQRPVPGKEVAPHPPAKAYDQPRPTVNGQGQNLGQVINARA